MNLKKVVSQKMYFSDLTKKTLEMSVNENLPLLLVGETGTGKTSFIRNMADERNIPLTRINLTGQTGVDEILGKWIVKGQTMEWIDGLLITAMKEGHFIVFDEINMALPEILSALHSLLDDDRFIVLKEKDGEKIECHERFRFFATMNPSEEYAGTKELNKAFYSRFPLVLDVGYSDKEVEILMDRSGISEEDAKRLVLAAGDVRKAKLMERISYTCSTRDLIYGAELIKKGFKPSEALQLAIFNKIEDKEQRETVKEIFKLVMGRKIILRTNRKAHEFESTADITKKLEELDKLKQVKLNLENAYKEEIDKLKTQQGSVTNSYDKQLRSYQKNLIEKTDKLERLKTITEKLVDELASLGAKQKRINELFKL